MALASGRLPGYSISAKKGEDTKTESRRLFDRYEYCYKQKAKIRICGCSLILIY